MKRKSVLENMRNRTAKAPKRFLPMRFGVDTLFWIVLETSMEGPVLPEDKS